MRFVVAMAFCAVALAGPVTKTSDNQDGVELRLSVPAVQVSVEPGLNGTFSTLSLEGAAVFGEPGNPGLPVYRVMVEVPFGARVVVQAEPSAVEEQALAAPLYPVQLPVPKSGPQPQFAYDAAAYAKDAFGTEIGAKVVEVAEVRGHRVATIEMTPVSYNPARNVLRVCRELRVAVSWTGGSVALTRRMHERYASPLFAGRVRDVVVNPDRFEIDGPPELPVGYLIIVPDSWQAQVAPLAEWRRRKGWNVFVRTLSQVGGGQSNTVRNYLQNAYDNWPIPPSIVMLVGDVNQVGFFTGQGEGTPPTDLNFSMLAGTDYLPDIDLCRASVVNAAQLDSLVAKTIRYEQVSGSGGTEWLEKAYFIASIDGGNHQVTERTHQYCLRKLQPMGVVCDSLWLYYNSGTPITTAINGGRAWVTYSGHGNTNCWADPDFYVSDVHELTNTDLVPWVQTYACLSGDYTSSSYPECFSESWIRNGRRGALCHMASTVNSYWTEDDTLQRRVFDYMFDSLYCLPATGMNRAKLKYYVQMGNNATTRRYFEMYNAIGDGAVDIHWQEPAAVSATYPPVIPLGAYNLPVTVQAGGNPVRNALVCACAKNDATVFASAYTDASGQTVLNITTTAPDSIYLTVTGHNLAPHRGAVLALPSSGPYVMLLRYAVDDSAGGNHDHIVNPGETVNLPAWLKNWGSAVSNNTRAWLRSTDPNVTLLDTFKTFGNVAAGDSAYTGAAGFRFTAAPACTNGYSLRLSLAVKDANDSTWTSSFGIVVGAPVLNYVANAVEDPLPGGNNNGMLEPGESGDLMVTLRNTGLGHAYGVTAVLRSGDSRLVVLDSAGAFGTILRDSTGTNAADRFRVSASSSIPRETQVPCTLHARVGAATYVRPFALGIGVIRTCDPIPDNAQPTGFWAYDNTDSLYVQHPEFNWVEIRGVGTRLTLSDDQTTTLTLPTGFGPWLYYGQSYTQVSVCSNGWIAPGSTTTSTYSNTGLPNTSMPPAVFVNWDDLYPPAGGGVWYYHDAANHRFIVEWDSVRYYSGTNYDKNQIVIHDTVASYGENDILLQYLTATQTSSATVGLQDETKTIAIQDLFDGAYHRGAASITAGRAILFSTDPPSVGIEERPAASATPARLAFVSCGPNPVRRQARLSYAVPRQARVSLGVFDATGRRVAVLFDGTQQPGIHSVTWNRQDDAGRFVGHGIYFYRLESDGAKLVRKAVVLE